MARPRKENPTVSATGNVTFGVALPVEMIKVLDEWAVAGGFIKYDGTTNRSGALRALMGMWLADDRYLEAAIKASSYSLAGTIAEVAQAAYREAYQKICKEIDKIHVQ